MAGDPDTAKKQNDLRREQKRKQRMGRGKNRHQRNEQVEEARLSRHLKGDWSPETKTLLMSRLADKEGFVITSRTLHKLMLDGKLSVVVKDEDNVLINGKTFFVTKEGFKDEDGDSPQYAFYSVTVEVGGGFGYQMRWDRSGRMFVG